MKRLLSVFLIIPALVLALTSCSPLVSQTQKEDIAEFYQEFVTQATSLDNDKIQQVYDELSQKPTEGRNTDEVRKEIFDGFNTVNPELFDTLAVEYSSYDTLGAVYTQILQMSLATKGEPVIVEFPYDAITKEYDPVLEIDVYVIDRSQITATVPLIAESSITRPDDRTTLNPVKITKDGDTYKIVPTEDVLTEIGVPAEK